MNKKSKTRIYLLRHGQTEWNASSRLQGHTDSLLTKTGIKQVEISAKKLRNRSIEFSSIYCSDLKRARDSAEIVTKEFGKEPIQTSAEYRERNFGVYEGKVLSKLKQDFPIELAKMGGKDPSFRPVDGESILEFHTRCKDSFEKIREQNLDKNSLLVCHGGYIREVFRYVFSLPLDHKVEVVCDNASLSVFVHNGKSWKLELWNHT